jgi:hypothetical protein
MRQDSPFRGQGVQEEKCKMVIMFYEKGFNGFNKFNRKQ